jgi:hypothetical protein
MSCARVTRPDERLGSPGGVSGNSPDKVEGRMRVGETMSGTDVCSSLQSGGTKVSLFSDRHQTERGGASNGDDRADCRARSLASGGRLRGGPLAELQCRSPGLQKEERKRDVIK